MNSLRHCLLRCTSFVNSLCLIFAVRCLLFLVYLLFFVDCRILLVVCCVLCVACCSLLVVCSFLLVAAYGLAENNRCKKRNKDQCSLFYRRLHSNRIETSRLHRSIPSYMFCFDCTWVSLRPHTLLQSTIC